MEGLTGLFSGQICRYRQYPEKNKKLVKFCVICVTMFEKGRVKCTNAQIPSLLGKMCICTFEERSDRESEAFEALPVTYSGGYSTWEISWYGMSAITLE